MGKKSRDKGAKFEREVVNFHRDMGIASERVTLSGAMKGSYAGDVVIHGMTAECKIRANGFKELYGWLEHDDADFLVIRADRRKPLYVLPEETWVKFLEWSEIKK